MSRALTMSAVLAWIVIQVPVVFCSTACGQSVSHLLAAGDHACHDEESDAHHRRCAHDRTEGTDSEGTDSDHPTDGDTDDERGDHVVITIQSSTCGSSVDLPDSSSAVDSWVCADLLRDGLLIEQATERDSRQTDPPTRVDPVSTSVQLQV